ncbi:DEAD/DEAH box helicase [Planctomycetes bacterium CA13]|uniref:DEAD/DEAH box helicase n=1 Tax=Novipirellula herctigrandis TaxID=2527986 RepID=A0A5C5ZCL4_9BACT|nr:DEAD/DEAH box helicase [Planctomycetes bacterium CA13]
MLYAHSPKAKDGITAQTYRDHIQAVYAGAVQRAMGASGQTVFASLFNDAVRLAAEFHDLGKLDPLNQAVLSSEGKGRLPINHVDAGTAEMLRRTSSRAAMVAALLIYSHHRGLPDFSELQQNQLRDITVDESLGLTKLRTDRFLDEYVNAHEGETDFPIASSKVSYQSPKNLQLLSRFALSCLVDADHFDTSANYGQAHPSPQVHLRPSERLKQLDRYVASLKSNKEDKRNQLRGKVYASCRSSNVPRGIVACDSPVGSGKTTAVMAHLLQVGRKHKMRRIFVVLPYTNIITQSVDVYRKCLVLAGENPEHVVAAHHHRAEFSDPQSRHLTYLWEAPIVVTTAVQFFETLAAARTGTLRKLHQLAASAVFIDESHAALPASLWPIAWKWLQSFRDEWNCHFVMGSGSLSQFWTLPEFASPPVQIPELIDEAHSQASSEFEAERIHYQSQSEPLDLDQLVDWVDRHSGPRLLIVNTVQSAGYIAMQIKAKTGRRSVEHLSTALAPVHRERTLSRIRSRLDDKSDTDWTLVATSCVEAGVDISFRTGFRERSSLNSLLQTSGRVNRSGEYGAADVWDFQLVFDHRLRKHPAFEDSAEVLGQLFSEDRVALQFCTEAMRREIRRCGMKSDAKLLLEAEEKQQFVEVQSRFKVIDSNTDVAVVLPSLKNRLRANKHVSFQDLQSGSVQIYSNRRADFALSPIVQRPGVFEWTLKYDKFLGYMAGIIDNVELLDGGVAFA